MYERGCIGAIAPITEFQHSEVEAAMRFMQKGNHIGKIVVTLPENFEELKESSASIKQFTLSRDGCYLIIGGLGGLGQAIAVWVAEAGASERKYIFELDQASLTAV